MSEAVLAASGLCKAYPSGDRRIDVLRGVDLVVHAGESVAIRGESGSGKSTLLNLLAGLDVPDAGTLAWAGEPAAATRRSRYLGMVFQSFYLIPELDALDNVLMAARIAGRAGVAERERARTLLTRVGLAERLAHVPAHLSGGERQRVAIARALMNSPRLVLADEPTGNLDRGTADGVFAMVLELAQRQGTSFVMVTHDPTLAARCDRQFELGR